MSLFERRQDGDFIDGERVVPKVAESMTPLVEAAVAMHELFETLVAGGFEVDEALTIVAKCIHEAGEKA